MITHYSPLLRAPLPAGLRHLTPHTFLFTATANSPPPPPRFRLRPLRAAAGGGSPPVISSTETNYPLLSHASFQLKSLVAPQVAGDAGKRATPPPLGGAAVLDFARSNFLPLGNSVYMWFRTANSCVECNARVAVYNSGISPANSATCSNESTNSRELFLCQLCVTPTLVYRTENRRRFIYFSTAANSNVPPFLFLPRYVSFFVIWMWTWPECTPIVCAHLRLWTNFSWIINNYLSYHSSNRWDCFGPTGSNSWMPCSRILPVKIQHFWDIPYLRFGFLT